MQTVQSKRTVAFRGDHGHRVGGLYRAPLCRVHQNRNQSNTAALVQDRENERDDARSNLPRSAIVMPITYVTFIITHIA